MASGPLERCSMHANLITVGEYRLEGRTGASTSEQAGELRDEDLTSPGCRAEPGRLDDRGTEIVPLLATDLPGTDPDAYSQGPVGHPPVVARCGLLHGNCAGQGCAGVGEGCHDPIAQGLDLLSAAHRDGFTKQGEVRAAQDLGGILSQPGN